MARLPKSTSLDVEDPTTLPPLHVLRTETVLSRFPIHQLSKRGRVAIHIVQTDGQGEVDLRWIVSYNDLYGPPGPLAYKLDTLVINQRLDALPRPVPRVLKLGSLRQICRLLDLHGSGKQQAYIKSAFHQNASAYITATLRYQGRDGTTRRLHAGFTRYSVLLTGERLPDGTTADAVHLVLHEPYREVLTHAPVRPLNYAYLKGLTPIAQRFYEILSYRMFAALRHRRPHATLRYADYCLLSTQHRSPDPVHVQKQMYKVHRPHLQSGYITHVQYDAITDADGQPDWRMQYTPGPKARAEYAAFLRQPGAEAALVPQADADQEDLVVTVARGITRAIPPPPRALDQETATPPTEAMQTDALALVTAFYQCFHRVRRAIPQPKELDQAVQLLAQHGAAKAQYLVDFSARVAPKTQYQPQTFGGILHYLPQALAAFDARMTQATTPQAEADARQWEERYVQWRQEALAQHRAALPPDELAALEAESRARLVAEGTRAFALGLAVRVAVDAALEVRAGLPSFADWRQTQEAGR